MTKRRPMMAGNWKMHKNVAEAVGFIESIGRGLEKDCEVEVVVCPPFIALSAAAAAIDAGGLDIGLGAQNMHWEEEGAFTGEISPLMLADLGLTYVIIGHSERRQYFGETDETVNKKLRSALDHGLRPIFCVGETFEQHEAGQTSEIIGHQIKEGLSGINDNLSDRLIIAYEPIWAIGTGKVAEPEDANDVIRHIRAMISSLYGVETARDVRLLYGGSVKPDNVSKIMSEPEIDGALVGGACLKPDAFLSLINHRT
ncbi:MAG TPA: triose-phosphate isomerase [Actinobacteria bacterium]|nr:triose-phosphate isomerase [Actinomycetota bacterium]